VSQRRIPVLISIFFTIDLALATAYAFDYLAGQPYGLVTRLLDLGREGNLPTWYSSVQWFSVAALLAIFGRVNFRISHLNSWPLLMLPMVFLAFSMDEVAAVHERLGNKLDIFLPGGSRQNTVFSTTGIWMFVIGFPFIAFVGVLSLSLRTYFRDAPGAFIKIVLGVAITLAGALGIETIANFVGSNSAQTILQVISEELCEMLGSTIVLWGSYDLLYRYRFTLTVDEVELD
jgi:hypothetical protein